MSYANRFRRLCIFFVVAAATLIGERGFGATFTSNLAINEGDSTYDGQIIVVSGATLIINGFHSFNSIWLTNNAVLTHSACTPTNTHKLELVVSGAVVVSTNSRIDVSGQGYLVGRTTGNSTVGGATGTSGGSYGGQGGVGPDPVLRNPLGQLGSTWLSSISFADRHVENHKWRDPRTELRPYQPYLVVPNDPDIAWLQEHCCSRK